MREFCVCLCFAMHYFVSILVLQTSEKEEKADCLLILPYRCIVIINVLWLFLTVLWVGLQCVIVVFPDHTHLLFYYENLAPR